MDAGYQAILTDKPSVERSRIEAEVLNYDLSVELRNKNARYEPCISSPVSFRLSSTIIVAPE